MTSRFTELVVDCHDPQLLADFWQQVLDYEVTETDSEGRWIELGGDESSGPRLLFLDVPDEKVVKNRVHIDVNPVDRDQAEEVERVIGLGARRIDIGQGDVRWVVLADPEGNEFCILPTRRP